ncbi:MAG: DUF2480 family protein [Fidelibacterota bacterium]
METIYLDDFLDNGILKEQPFRQAVNAIDWSQYYGKKVLIKGCSDVPVPTWSYLIITAHLAQHADHILYGEPCSTITVFKQNSH